jgi:hypothetical protein
MTSLKRLVVSVPGWYKGECQVSDKGLIHLKDLASLEWLSFYRCPITGSGLVHLRNLDSLRWLNLSRTQIRDEHLVHLKFLRRLMWLRLNDTSITDGAIEHLKDLTSLYEVYIPDTKISRAGVERLRQELPPYSHVLATRGHADYGAAPRLTQKQAEKLAATMANNECERLYGTRPFTPARYPVVLDNHTWRWGCREHVVGDGFSAEVQFDLLGQHRSVRVYSSLNQH